MSNRAKSPFLKIQFSGNRRPRTLSSRPFDFLAKLFRLANRRRRSNYRYLDMATKTEEKTGADKLTVARNKNLDLAIQQIAKDYGDGAIMRLGDEKIVDIDVIPTGNVMIERALSGGGMPWGRVVYDTVTESYR